MYFVSSGVKSLLNTVVVIFVSIANAANLVYPVTPKSDQVQISPAAFPVILHHTVWRTWLFIAYSDWKMIILPILTTPLIYFSLKGWENVLFELGSERVNIFKRQWLGLQYCLCTLQMSSMYPLELNNNYSTLLHCKLWALTGSGATPEDSGHSHAIQNESCCPPPWGGVAPTPQSNQDAWKEVCRVVKIPAIIQTVSSEKKIFM